MNLKVKKSTLSKKYWLNSSGRNNRVVSFLELTLRYIAFQGEGDIEK